MKDTRQALLEAACEVFAEKGFQEANVADICQRAEANIAAVNYHFGGKEKLYVEVLSYARDIAEREHPLMCDPAQVRDPRERLSRFIQAQFKRVFCEGLAGCFDRLVVHEATSPTFAHDTDFITLVCARRRYLSSLIQELLPADISEAHLRICTHNVISLFAFSNFMRASRERRQKLKKFVPPSPAEMAEFATVFALGGIEAIAREASAAAPTRKQRVAQA